MNPPLVEKGGGQWTQEESEDHINQLEIRAVRFALAACYDDVHDLHIRIFSDNSTTVSALNHQGSVRSKACDKEAHIVWQWAEARDCWLSAAFVPGVLNCVADEKSRKFNHDSEWSLNDAIFQEICKIFGQPDIDLFASRLNYKIKPFCSWSPEPGAAFVDAFTVKWSDFTLPFIFPPFSMVARVLQQLDQYKMRAIVVLPWWPTQSWFGTFSRMIMDVPRLIKVKRGTLSLKHNLALVHPMVGKLHLIAVKLSATASDVEAFLVKYRTQCSMQEKKGLECNTKYTLKHGMNIVVRGVSVRPEHLSLNV